MYAQTERLVMIHYIGDNHRLYKPDTHSCDGNDDDPIKGLSQNIFWACITIEIR